VQNSALLMTVVGLVSRAYRFKRLRATLWEMKVGLRVGRSVLIPSHRGPFGPKPRGERCGNVGHDPEVR